MPESTTLPVTDLLNRWCRGDGEAADALFAKVYPRLKLLARRALRKRRDMKSLHTTELVAEAYVRLERYRDVSWKSREQLYALASMMMKRAIVDARRFEQRDRRGGGLLRIELDERFAAETGPGTDAMMLGEAIERLERDYPRPAAIITMRYYGGMTVKEIASSLELSVSSVEEDWRLAMAWLRRHLAAG